jgi:hypothetical protein
MIYEYEKEIAITWLQAEIETSDIEGDFIGITEKEGTAYIEFESALALSEKEKLDDLLDAHVVKPIRAAVSSRQIRLALLGAGIALSDIDAFIDSLDEPDKTIIRVYWEYSLTFEYTEPLLIQMATAFGLTSEEYDNLFIEAAKL